MPAYVALPVTTLIFLEGGSISSIFYQSTAVELQNSSVMVSLTDIKTGMMTAYTPQMQSFVSIKALVIDELANGTVMNEMNATNCTA